MTPTPMRGTCWGSRTQRTTTTARLGPTPGLLKNRLASLLPLACRVQGSGFGGLGLGSPWRTGRGKRCPFPFRLERICVAVVVRPNPTPLFLCVRRCCLQAIAAMSRAKEANPANLSVLLALGVSHTNGMPDFTSACSATAVFWLALSMASEPGSRSHLRTLCEYLASAHPGIPAACTCSLLCSSLPPPCLVRVGPLLQSSSRRRPCRTSGAGCSTTRDTPPSCPLCPRGRPPHS